MRDEPLAGHVTFDTPEKAYAEAERRITKAKTDGAAELLFDLDHLERLPPSLAELSTLRRFALGSSSISNITPLTRLTSLQSLTLGGQQISDLTPLADLTSLQSLILGNLPVSDLTPIGALTSLQVLGLEMMPVSQLEPLTKLTSLKHLILDHLPVTDISPLSRLSNLQYLWLWGTQVAVLEPLAEMTRMIEAVHQRAVSRDSSSELGITAGLEYRNSPIAQREPFKRFSELEEPARTIETINYLRRQQGLPEHIPKGYQRPEGIDTIATTELPDPTTIPDQALDGLVWGGPEDQPLRLVGLPNEGPIDTPEQHDYYKMVRTAAEELGRACNEFGNNRLAAHRRLIDQLLTTMGTALLELQLRPFWSQMNALRRRLEANRAALTSTDPETPPLPEELGGLLADLVDKLNLFSAGDTTLERMDRLALDPATRISTDKLVAAALEIARAAKHSPAIDTTSAEVLEQIASDAEGASPSAHRAKEVAARSARNLVLELLRRVYGAAHRGGKWGVTTIVNATALVFFAAVTEGMRQFIVQHQAFIRELIQSFGGSETLFAILDWIIKSAK